MLIDLPHLLGQVISNTSDGFSKKSFTSKLLSINIVLFSTNFLNVVTPIALVLAASLNFLNSCSNCRLEFSSSSCKAINLVFFYNNLKNEDRETELKKLPKLNFKN